MKEQQKGTIEASLKVQIRATVLVTYRGIPSARRLSLEVLGLDGRETEKSVPVLYGIEPRESTSPAVGPRETEGYE